MKTASFPNFWTDSYFKEKFVMLCLTLHSQR